MASSYVLIYHLLSVIAKRIHSLKARTPEFGLNAYLLRDGKQKGQPALQTEMGNGGTMKILLSY